MRRPDEPDDIDVPFSLRTDELEVPRFDEDDLAVTGRRPAPDVLVPFDDNSEDAITEEHRAPRPSDPTLYDPSSSPLSELGARHAIPPAAGSAPPPTASEPEPLTPAIPMRSEYPASPPSAEPEAPLAPPPPWVADYLLLCVVLTVIGLVVLFFEHRLTGHASVF